MTPADIAVITRAIGPVMRDVTAKAVADAVAPLLERNAALELRILELETRPPVVGPVGPMGVKGEPGARGEVGPQGLQGIPGPIGERGPKGDTGERGPQGEAGHQGEKGMDGTHGRDGRDGMPGLPGAPGEKGMDGRNGVDGINGKDGRDGLGFDDADLVLDETRGWILRMSHGDRVKEWAIPMPFFAGNWEAGQTYPKGAGVRWDGHYWWALNATHTQPGEGSTDWQIVVSRGKQGREGKQGKDGAPGRDLTQMDPMTGRKW